MAGTLIPVFMDAGQGAVEQQIGSVIDGSAETHQMDSANNTHEQQGAIYRAGHVAAASPMESFMAKHGIPHDDNGFGQDLEEALNSGYTKGTNGEDQLGVLPSA